MPRIPCCEIVGPGLQSSPVHDFEPFKNVFRPVNGPRRPSGYQAAVGNRWRIFEACSPLVRRREHLQKTFPIAGMPPGIQQAGLRKGDGGATDCSDGPLRVRLRRQGPRRVRSVRGDHRLFRY